jgi:hypothetical protein
MYQKLAAGPEVAYQPTRVVVAGEQHYLKEKKADCPDGRTSAEPRKDCFADQWLNLKAERGPEKHGDSKNE